MKMELVKFRNKKYVEIERYSDERVRLMIQEIERYDIYSQLDKTIVSDPTKNFDSFSRRIIEIKNRFIPRKRVKFNRKKHKLNEWITPGIIKSINTKDAMYKELKKKSLNSQVYALLKINFTTYKRILRKSITDAKKTVLSQILR